MTEFCTDELDRSDLERCLRELNFGYRARYVQEAVQFIKHTAGGMIFFDQLKILSTKDARTQLSKIMGVGRKVSHLFKILFLFISNAI